MITRLPAEVYPGGPRVSVHVAEAPDGSKGWVVYEPHVVGGDPRRPGWAKPRMAFAHRWEAQAWAQGVYRIGGWTDSGRPPRFTSLAVPGSEEADPPWGDALLGLWRAALDAPFDDTVRLVLADALEESGDAPRAAYIREAVAGRGGQPSALDGYRWGCHREMWRAGQFYGLYYGPSQLSGVQFTRGLLGCVRGSVKQLALACGPVCAAQPVTEFSCTDLWCSKTGDRHPTYAVTAAPFARLDNGEWVDNEYDLPGELIPHMGAPDGVSAGVFQWLFETRAATDVAVSRALVGRGRHLAGLSPLIHT